MILSNIEIQKALDDGRLVIDPEPNPRVATVEQDSPFNTSSVDLRLGSFLSIPQAGSFNYDLRGGKIAQFLSSISKTVDISQSEYLLAPNTFVLGKTLEKIKLPLDCKEPLAARIEGKSSFARCGLLVHFTAPTVHGGFEGTLTIEMINLGNTKITLYSGMAICQLVFETLYGEIQPNPSQFQNQTTPAGNKE